MASEHHGTMTTLELWSVTTGLDDGNMWFWEYFHDQHQRLQNIPYQMAVELLMGSLRAPSGIWFTGNNEALIHLTPSQRGDEDLHGACLGGWHCEWPRRQYLVS
jgi:hypothetical protein